MLVQDSRLRSHQSHRSRVVDGGIQHVVEEENIEESGSIGECVYVSVEKKKNNKKINNSKLSHPV